MSFLNPPVSEERVNAREGSRSGHSDFHKLASGRIADGYKRSGNKDGKDCGGHTEQHAGLIGFIV